MTGLSVIFNRRSNVFAKLSSSRSTNYRPQKAFFPVAPRAVVLFDDLLAFFSYPTPIPLRIRNIPYKAEGAPRGAPYTEKLY